jgi:hypothetical protein
MGRRLLTGCSSRIAWSCSALRSPKASGPRASRWLKAGAPTSSRRREAVARAGGGLGRRFTAIPSCIPASTQEKTGTDEEQNVRDVRHEGPRLLHPGPP